MGHHQLDALDEQILKLIAGNARIPFLEVARACNVSGAAIHQPFYSYHRAGCHCRITGTEEIHSGKCRHIEDRYIDFRSHDICGYLHYCCAVILPGTCIEHNC